MSNSEIDDNSIHHSQDFLDILSSFELDKYVMRLYISHKNETSVRAIHNLKQLFEERLKGRYELEIIDIHQQPESLEKDHIFAVPTLVKELPPPIQRIIGDMTDKEKLVTALDL
ncbi:circadian clock KaiB family protein [Calothrix rhizosoleniae]|uniref:circadian clock KaiB family protein n=1 Tax=Calothrix rhizosoleniae TaxID=888997 RepID=UPI000B49E177|nr:circadian clock KaiB family protein [Calothrix rhizosoleniae]